MPLEKRGEWWYGDSQDDIPTEILQYSVDIGVPAHQFADAVCHCGERIFQLSMDYDAGVAIRNCVTCRDDHFIGDSEEHVEKASLKDHDCFCGEDSFEITVGVSLAKDGKTVEWVYLGCRCPTCGLTGVYGDWRHGSIGCRDMLDRV